MRAPLPAPRGPLSAGVLAALRDGGPPAGPAPGGRTVRRGRAAHALLPATSCTTGVSPGSTRNGSGIPTCCGVRRELELAFLAALRADVPPGDDVEHEIAALLTEPVDAEGTGVSHHLLRDGEAWQLREYLAHRSLYHLKEADPQAWVIPRLPAAAKAALVTVEYDEYGAGDPERVHARLFADDAARRTGLDDRYGAYLDLAPARDAGRGQPDVAVRAAPRPARRARRAVRHRRADLLARLGPAGPGDAPAWASPRRRRRSTPSTSRPTPCTSS